MSCHILKLLNWKLLTVLLLICVTRQTMHRLETCVGCCYVVHLGLFAGAVRRHSECQTVKVFGNDVHH